MKFEKRIMDHQACWVSGIYKVVKYDKWKAFFKPSGWTNWGNSCEYTNTKRVKSYRTKRDAIAACKRHNKTFPSNPSCTQKILNT